MKSLDLFCAFSPQLFSLAVSLDSIRIDCALNEAMIKVHPIAEWWVSQLSISQSIKIGLSFVHPCCVCTWLGSCQPRAAMACHHVLSIQVSNVFSYDNFCSPLLVTISPPLSSIFLYPLASQAQVTQCLHLQVQPIKPALASRKPQPRFSSHAPPIDFFIDEVEVAILTTSGGAGLCIDWWWWKHCFLFP